MTTQQFVFVDADKSQSLLRLGLYGPPKSGKTLSALLIAEGIRAKLAEETGEAKVIRLIDTERGSAPKHADSVKFQKLDLLRPDPDSYVAAINASAQDGRCAVLVIDGATPEWKWCLNEIDRLQGTGQFNKWQAWSEVDPMHDRFIDAFLTFPGHVILTMRANTEWILEDDENKQGRITKKPKAIGIKPEQRSGGGASDVLYDIDVIALVDLETHGTAVRMSRYKELDKRIWQPATAATGAEILEVVRKGTPAPAPMPQIAREAIELARNAIRPLAEGGDVAAKVKVAAFRKVLADAGVRDIGDLWLRGDLEDAVLAVLGIQKPPVEAPAEEREEVLEPAGAGARPKKK